MNDILDYGKNPEKTDGGRLVSCYECDPTYTTDQFLMKKQIYEQITNRKETNNERNVLAYHLIQSFAPEDNITPEQANKIGMDLARKFADDDFQIMVCTHIDTIEKGGVIHNHIYINSTSLDCSRKFDNVKDSALLLQNLSDEICKENGLSVIEEKGDTGLPYSEHMERKNGFDIREDYKAMIDELIPQCKNIDELKKKLQEKGYSVRGKKSLSIKHSDRTRGMKTERISDQYDYSLEGIKYAIQHNGRMLPKTKKIDLEADKKFNRLVTLDGKTGGLKNWAEKYNLKEVAKAYKHLKNNGFANYDELTAKIDSLTKNFNFASDKIKKLDSDLKANRALRVHIVNYARTVETYKAYKSSRHKEKFYEEHKGDMLLYEASTQAFKNLGLKSVPKVDVLDTSLASLKLEKSEQYTEYKKLRAELNELRPIKQNLNNFLFEDKKQEKAKEQEI